MALLGFHGLQGGPVPIQRCIWVEVRIVAHDVLVIAVEPGMAVLVVQLNRGAGIGIAVSLHAANELVIRYEG